jgi:hypothetical protein
VFVELALAAARGFAGADFTRVDDAVEESLTLRTIARPPCRS